MISSFLTAEGQIIKGTVLNKTGEPLQDVHITADYNGLVTTTDSNGEFLLDLTESTGETVTLFFSSVGYEPTAQKVDLSNPETDHIEIIMSESIYRSETVVVTATRTMRDIEEVSLPVSVVPGQEIEQSGSMRLSDVLSEQAGMQIVSDHGTGIQVQGIDADYTLIMIDGSPVIGRTAGTLDLSRISVRNVEQIEIVKGPSSALWGSEALAGVVNIITKSERENFSGGITTRYGENNTLDVSGDLSLNYGDLHNTLFFNRNSSDGYRLNPGTISQTVPDFENLTLGYRGNIDISDQLQLSGNFRWFNESQRNNSVVTGQDEESQLLNNRDDQSDLMLRGELSYTPLSRFHLHLRWLTSTYQTDSELISENSGDLFSASEFNQYFNTPELQAEYRWNNNHNSMFGGGAIFERLDSDRYSGQPNFTTQFFFAQHSWSPSLDSELIGGLRYDIHSEYSSQLSPKISARYQAAKWIQVRASVGRGFKAPEFRQLFLDFNNTTGGYSVFGSTTVAEGIKRQTEQGLIDRILIPVENLDEIRAESSWAFNGGFDLDPVDWMRIRVNLFHNNITDLIQTAPIASRTSGQFVYTYFNVDEVRTQGAETELRFHIGEQFRGSVGYQFLDARRKIVRERTVQNEEGELVQRTDSDFKPMFNRSRHTGNVKLFFKNDNGWGANLRGNFRGPHGIFDSNGNEFVDDEEFESGYTVWNVAVSKKIFDSFTVQAGADNLFDYRNVNQPFLAGRLWYGQISVSL